jgi:hypothetical protein
VLTPQTPFNLGYEVFREAQVMEGLLQDRSGVLRLEAVTLKALSRLEAAALSGFGLFFGVSCGGRHGALLCSIWVFCG